MQELLLQTLTVVFDDSDAGQGSKVRIKLDSSIFTVDGEEDRYRNDEGGQVRNDEVSRRLRAILQTCKFHYKCYREHSPSMVWLCKT